LSRHRKIQWSVAESGRSLGSRSKAVALIAAGAFIVATAATAAAATWPGGPGGPGQPRGLTAGRAHEADAGALLTVTGQHLRQEALQVRAFDQRTANQAAQADQIRGSAAGLSAAHWQAARAQAARAQAAGKPAARQVQTTPSAANPATAPPSASGSASARPAPSATASVASGSPQQIARAMLASFGWSSSQFSCLDPLWAHESGWSVTAYNAGSGAYGIPQALPGSRMASAGPNWQTNAATQIRWGLEYIKGTYGSPCAAWDHEQATGWY
jgi:hypothetical protein